MCYHLWPNTQDYACHLYPILAQCSVNTPPEKFTKPKVFWSFQRVQKRNVWLKWDHKSPEWHFRNFKFGSKSKYLNFIKVTAKFYIFFFQKLQGLFSNLKTYLNWHFFLTTAIWYDDVPISTYASIIFSDLFLFWRSIIADYQLLMNLTLVTNVTLLLFQSKWVFNKTFDLIQSCRVLAIDDIGHGPWTFITSCHKI